MADETQEDQPGAGNAAGGDEGSPLSGRIRCARCGKRAAVPILWGFPNPEDLDKVESGEWDVVIGGCVVPDPLVNVACQRCGHRWLHDDEPR